MRRMRRLGFALVIAATAAILTTPPRAAAQPPGVPPIGMVCTNGPTFHLTTSTGYVETPDGNSVFMWGYANADTGGHFQNPGPILCVNQGDTVTVTLHNTLAEPASVVFPGQEGVTGTGSAGLLAVQAPPGGDASYSFVAGQPGTYTYESGSDPSKQVEMGMYGALVVRPTGHPNWAYDIATQFNPAKEFLILLAEIDPDLHHAVETGATYDFNALHNRYFTVNGRAFPDTLLENSVAWLPNQPYGALVRIQPYDPIKNALPALIRMANVGELNHPFHPHGNHLRMVAQDGRRFLSPSGQDASSEHFGETIGSGQTEDFLFSWTDQDSWNPTSNPFPTSVASPDYRKLTFKDNNTWFSGSPYLGKKGTLPTVVVSQNVCGEWYFPWHSHALNEFSNFDEGFGGMATLLRVDPLAGCTAYPTSTKITVGTVKSGSYASLGVVDTTYYQVNSTTTGGARTTDWYAGYTGIVAGSANLNVTYTGRNCTTATGCTGIPVSTTLWIWRWGTSSWVQLGASASVGGPADTSISRVPPAPQSDFIGTGSNAGQVRVRVLSAGGGTSFVTQGNLQVITYDAP
jgi:FtsP/CotA-like multicopper oxidase with cupredoxin domain